MDTGDTELDMDVSRDDESLGYLDRGWYLT